MRTLSLAAAVAGSLLLVSAASAQQDQNWRGTLDQLNRTVNPDSPSDDRRARDLDRDRRYEGSSRSDDRRGSSELSRYSDEDLRDRWDRLSDEQRQLQRERRVLEDEMGRRGMRR
ncbi:MAG TPA: hypothetical protein VD978_07420 [Azospirillum sp.]|nr:hypothetical protein [Azospirillum sp.]